MRYYWGQYPFEKLNIWDDLPNLHAISIDYQTSWDQRHSLDGNDIDSCSIEKDLDHLST
jgi:hypothetical protein